MRISATFSIVPFATWEMHCPSALQRRKILLQCFSMASNFLKTHFGSTPYCRIDQENHNEELLEKGDISQSSSSNKSRCYHLLLPTIFVALAGVGGYLLGSLNHHAECVSVYSTETVSSGKTSTYKLQMLSTHLCASVPIGASRSIFQYNSSFAAPPPKGAGSEPIWDSMIPSESLVPFRCPPDLRNAADGLGYIKDPTIAPNTSVISAFHQLHCLVHLTPHIKF